MYLDSTKVELKAYLEARARRADALAHMLKGPDHENGLAHTPREIAQQPHLWRGTARLMEREAAALRAFLKEAGVYDRVNPPHIVFSGAGSSDYVGISVVDLLRTRLQVPCTTAPTTRITADPGSFFLKNQRLVLVHVARSGNSPESMAVLKMALRDFPDQIRHIVITCNRHGALADCARDHTDRVFLIILDEACNDLGLAMTSSFTNMVLAGQALAFLDDMETFQDLVERVAGSGEQILDRYTDDIRELADPKLKRAYFLGNGDLYGASVESALKVQELTVGQITAKGEDTLAFRHGPVSAVEGHTMTCFYLSASPHTRRYEMDVLLQYQDAFDRLGAKTIVLTDTMPDAKLNPSVQVLTYDPEGDRQVPPLFQVNVSILFGQLFALFASQRRSLNVDDPSDGNGLYSRTVQGVRIYEDESSSRRG